jgi:plasmid stabilization system protein ParE
VRPVVFTPIARQELIDASDWYDNESPGLGARFLAKVDNVIERVAGNPNQFPVVHKTIRRALLRLFPYALMFVVEPDHDIAVIACFHGSRNPARWRQRM